MLNSFLVAFNAVMPFLIYLSLGYAVVHLHMSDTDFLKKLNTFNFKVVFPFLMFNNIYGVSADGLPSLRLIIASVGFILLLIFALMHVIPRIIRENSRRGVIIQAIFRSNFVLYGIPLTVSTFGQEKAAMAGIMVLIVVSVFNVAAVIVLEIFNGNKRVSFLPLLLKLLQNPMIQGCLMGLVFFLLKIRLPNFIASPIAAISGMATPLALITLGGTLQFSAVRKNMPVLAPSLAFKLIIMPLIVLPVSWLIGLRGVELFLMLMIFGTPVATSSYPMAMNMGGDGELAGQFVFVSTVVSLLTIFCFIFAMSQMGLLV